MQLDFIDSLYLFTYFYSFVVDIDIIGKFESRKTLG